MPVVEKDIEVDLSLLPEVVNEAYLPLYSDNKHRFVMVLGGAGSGKSVAIAQRQAVRIMSEPGHHIVAFRKVARTLKISVFAEFRKALSQLGVADLWRSNKTDLTYTFLPNQGVFRCMGLDDPEKLKSIVGMTGAWIEEATELTSNDFEQINLRLRGKTTVFKQVLATFNGISDQHWIKARFFDKEDSRCLTMQTTWEHNRFLDDEYKKELESLKDVDLQLWRIYARGEWGVLRGLIYDQFQYKDLPADPDDHFMGLDFGYSQPTALVECWIKDGIIYVKERFYKARVTNPGLIEWLDANDVPKYVPIYADPAEPDRIDEILKAGYHIMAVDKSPGTIYAGIMSIKSRKVYFADANPHMSSEASTYKWRLDRDGNPTDVPVDWNNHAMDAMRYAIYNHVAKASAPRIRFL